MQNLALRIAVCCSVLAACAQAPEKQRVVADEARPVAAPAPATEPAANDNLNAVAWTQTAIEHDLIYREVFRTAGEKLRIALKNPNWDALPNEERKHPVTTKLKPAVIVDIDETVLDNSPYQARLIEQGNAFDESSWSEWCREKRAKALPGALEFARAAAKSGVTVFYLSNRAESLNEATLENLRTDGFPIAEKETVFLGLGSIVDGCEQNGTEKGCRRELIGRTHRVLMQLGDQIGDFVDVGANTLEGRRAAIEPYLGWIGERWFVLPNPTYGSWEAALFGNDWRQPAVARRKAKLDALNNE
jgi:5'-nucleotidase (lipoprotein e(P4) family)